MSFLEVEFSQLLPGAEHREKKMVRGEADIGRVVNGEW